MSARSVGGQPGVLDVAAGVVEVVTGAGVDIPDGADHLGGEQDVVGGDDLEQQVDAGLVVDAGVEEDVAQDVFFQRWLLHRHRQPPEAAPVVGHGAAAVRNDQPQGGEVGEQVALDQLHEGGGVGVEVVRRRWCGRPG